MKRMGMLALIFGLALLIGVGMQIQGNANNGRPDGDMDFKCGCHSTVSPGSQISLEADSQTVFTGGEVQITATIASTEQAEGEWLGAMILAEKDGAAIQPSEAGWTITEDPNGGAYNYVQKAADASGGQTYVWKLKAPADTGEYALTVKEIHGGGTKYKKEYDGSITITVEADPDPPTGNDPGNGENGGGNGGGEAPAGNGDGEPDTPQVPDAVALGLGLVAGLLVVAVTAGLRYNS